MYEDGTSYYIESVAVREIHHLTFVVRCIVSADERIQNFGDIACMYAGAYERHNNVIVVKSSRSSL